jgi:RNA polymerase sigma-70 factor (ECF subfamily)
VPTVTTVQEHRSELMSVLVRELPGLRRYSRTLTRDPQQAEDLVQDTTVRALEKFDSFESRSSLATWLHRIMHNLAVDASRRRGETPANFTDEAAERVEVLWSNDSYTVDAAVVVEKAETRELLQDALLRIPLIYRSAVVLHDSEGLSVASIADIQQVSLAAAKQRLRRGRMMIVSELADGEHHWRAGVPMRCWDARQLVSDYMDDDLTERERGLLELHLETCPTCPPLYAGLVGVRQAMTSRRDPDEAVPAQLADRIRSLLDA